MESRSELAKNWFVCLLTPNQYSMLFSEKNHGNISALETDNLAEILNGLRWNTSLSF